MPLQPSKSRPRNRAGACALLVVVGGCGAAPTSPGVTPPPLTPGTYTLSVIAPDSVLVGDRLVSACPGAGPGGYGSIVAHARVETDGEASRVQPASAGDGTFELLLMRDTGRVQSEVAVAGSIRGVVVNTIAQSLVGGAAAADARATFAGSAPGTAARVEGAVHGGGAITSGLITGNVEVGNSGGAAVACAPGTVRLSLSRLP